MCEYSPHERSRPSGAKVSHVGNARSALAAAVQDLELRAYSASLVDTSFVGIAFGRSSGDIAFDPTLPISNVDATIYSPVLAEGIPSVYSANRLSSPVHFSTPGATSPVM